ncbi:MAG: hypothetical protein COA43_05425 [Robiginitomaculum sp.]|nr:MAG: hypothetical protein COA43_05425 [Robiginitomaculum sp.]
MKIILFRDAEFTNMKLASLSVVMNICFQAVTTIQKFILIGCYAFVIALSVSQSAFASEQRIGDFEIALDAPWRMEPRTKPPQLCNAGGGCGGATVYEYGAIPVNIAILDAFLPNANVENSFLLQRALQANESGDVSIVQAIKDLFGASGEFLSDYPNITLENFLSLTVSEETNGRFVARSVYRMSDLHEVERTSGFWQWDFPTSSPPERPIRELCRQWAGENCSAISTLRNTSEWQAIAMYTPLNKTPGTNVKLKLDLKVTARVNGNSGEHIFTQYVNVHLGEAPLPKFNKNWYYGDIHYHSQGTDNDGESGYSYRSALQAMSALGLDFAFATDHASNSKQIISAASGPIRGVSHVREEGSSLAVLRDLSPDRFAHGIEILNDSDGANREVASYPRKIFEFSFGSQRGLATPQLFLGAEVDIIPEYANAVGAKGGLAAFNSCYGLPLELKRFYHDGIEGVLAGTAGDYLHVSDTNPSVCVEGETLLDLAPIGRMVIRDVQGPHNGDLLTKEFHGRQHMLHLPEDPQNKTAFISSETSKYGGATRRLQHILNSEFNSPNGILFLAHPLSAASGQAIGRIGPDIVPYAEAPLLDAFRSQHVLGLQLWNENDHFETEMQNGEGKAVDAVREFIEEYKREHPMPQASSSFESLREISEYQREFSEKVKEFLDDYGCEDYNCIGYKRGEIIPVYDLKNWKHETTKSYNPRVNRIISGLNMWDSMLMWGLDPNLTSSIDWLPTGDPRRVFMAGGSDAHGDYNYKRNGYAVGLETIGDGAMGSPRNLVFAGPPQGAAITAGGRTGTPVGQKQIVDAFRDGNFIVTDGPIIRMAYDKNRNGKIDSGDIQMGGVVRTTRLTRSIYPLLVEWKSTPEFGRVKNIKLVLGVYADEYSEGWLYRAGQPTQGGLTAWKEIATGRTLDASLHDFRGQRGKRHLNFTDPTNNSVLTLNISPSQGYSGLRRIFIDPFEFPIATLAERIETERALCDAHARVQVSSTFKTLKSTLTYKSKTLKSRLKAAPKPIQKQKNGVMYKRIDNNRVERPTVGGEISVIPDIEPRPPYFCKIKTFTNPVVPDRMFIRAELEGKVKGNIPYKAFTNPIWFKDIHKSVRPVGDGAAPSRVSKGAPVNMSPAPTNKPCSKSSITVCQRNGASCDVLKSKTGASRDVCRWKSKSTVRECNRTIGIWTTAKSKYAQNYPRAIIPGALGACITEVTNVKNRIQ